MHTIRVPRSGLSYSPVYEMRMAAHWDGWHWDDFCDLDGDEQSAIVALYRTHMQAEAVLAQDLERKRRRAANKK